MSSRDWIPVLAELIEELARLEFRSPWHGVRFDLRIELAGLNLQASLFWTAPGPSTPPPIYRCETVIPWHVLMQSLISPSELVILHANDLADRLESGRPTRSPSGQINWITEADRTRAR